MTTTLTYKKYVTVEERMTKKVKTMKEGFAIQTPSPKPGQDPMFESGPIPVRKPTIEEEGYWKTFTSSLSEILNTSLELLNVAPRKTSQIVTIDNVQEDVPNEVILYQDWSKDGDKTKPITVLQIETPQGDEVLKLGHRTMWDDAVKFAKDIAGIIEHVLEQNVQLAESEMKVGKQFNEKRLRVALLKEQLKNVTGKRIILEDATTAKERKALRIGEVYVQDGVRYMKTQRGWAPINNGKVETNRAITDFDLAQKKQKPASDSLRQRVEAASTRFYNLQDLMNQFVDDLLQAKSDLKQLYIDQEQEIPAAGGTGTEKGDAVANQYGGQMMELEADIEDLKAQIVKLKPKLDRASQAYDNLRYKL